MMTKIRKKYANAMQRQGCRVDLVSSDEWNMFPDELQVGSHRRLRRKSVYSGPIIALPRSDA